MPLSPGTRLGSYEITAPLGAGGMGEVYRATDHKLGREVAVKVLPEDFAQQPDRLARFEREAKVLASLNHPNIASIYGLEESDGVRCLILELVEGKTLHELIGAGALPVDRVMGFALQIAEALEVAHEKGIVHRDLKPANVIVTPEGVVKVLDFGLAKAFAEESDPDASASMSPTMTAAATQAGVIIGTAAYMSPEQAAGQSADRRSDIFSFGVVVLEMLTGRRIFSGETVSHVLASVLKDEPDWERLPPDLPERLGEMVQACLRKKPRLRLQAIGDARVLLEEYRGDPASFQQTSQAAAHRAGLPTGKPQRLPWVVAALLAAALTAALWGLWSRDPVVEPITYLSIPSADGESIFPGYGSSVVVSPDGSQVAYVLIKEGKRQLYLRSLDRWDPTTLISTDQDPYNPFFSPDGQWLGFVTISELKKVPVRGGSPLTLSKVDRNRGATWGADGRIIFSPDPQSGLFVVPAAGGESEPLTFLDAEKKERGHRWPQILPGGEAVLFTSFADVDNSGQPNLELLVLKTNERRLLQKGASYGRYVQSGHVVYADGLTLFAFPFDLEALQATGSPAPVLEGVASSAGTGGAQFDVSGEGTLVYTAGIESQGTRIVWVDAAGESKPLWEEAQEYARPALSPDGTRLAVEIWKEGDSDIWVYDLARGVPMRLTFDKGADRSPVWSPDSAWIYYSSERDGTGNLHRRAADGSGEPELVLKREERITPTSISLDGKLLVVNESLSNILLVDLEGGEPNLFLAGSPTAGYGRFSPDSRWVIYNSNESGIFRVYVRPTSGEAGKWQISTGAGAYPRWAGDGRAIYFRTMDGAMMKASINTAGGKFSVERPVELFEGGEYQSGRTGIPRFDVAPNDELFVMLQRPEGSTRTHDHIRVVHNWFEVLRRTFNDGG
jgi:serine/threonine protein kinase/Tol biopolymer transport system component